MAVPAGWRRSSPMWAACNSPGRTRPPFVPAMIVPYMSIDLLFALSLFVIADRRDLRTHVGRIVLVISVRHRVLPAVPAPLRLRTAGGRWPVRAAVHAAPCPRPALQSGTVAAHCPAGGVVAGVPSRPARTGQSGAACVVRTDRGLGPADLAASPDRCADRRAARLGGALPAAGSGAAPARRDLPRLGAGTHGVRSDCAIGSAALFCWP